MTPTPVLSPLSQAKKRRNWAVFLALLAFVVIIYIVTLIKIHVTGGL